MRLTINFSDSEAYLTSALLGILKQYVYILHFNDGSSETAVLETAVDGQATFRLFNEETFEMEGDTFVVDLHEQLESMELNLGEG